jgi:sugar O-acyltransferase (sialic acid O-acetyltransferase NeuD family)
MYLYGASGHCKVIIDIIKSSTEMIVEGVFDDNKRDNTILDIPVIEFSNFKQKKIEELIISVGNNATRKKLAEAIQTNYISVIHKSAVISKYAIINDGTVVMANAVVNAASIIGKHCIINSCAVVEHDCELSNYVHIAPNTALAGNVKVGEGSQIGIGATVIQGVTIGKWVTIGAGSVVIEDVPDFAVVVGNPAKVIKYTKL